MSKKLWFTLFVFALGANGIQAEDEFGDLGDFGMGMGMEEPEPPIETTWQLDYPRSASFELIYIPEDNFKFGEYNGHSEEGFHFAGDLDIISRPEHGSSDTGFWVLRADDIGLKTGSLEFEAGRQGNYTFSLDLKNHFSVRNDTGVTPFRGDEFLSLPNNWVPSNNTSGMSLNGLHSVEQEIERNQVNVSFEKKLGDWAVTGRYDYEHKTGDRAMGGAMYINAANPHAAILPVPQDYDNHEFGLVFDYATQALQMQLSVLTSEFEHDDEQLRWQNPYDNVFFNDLANYPDGVASLDQPADKRFQQVRFMGNYRMAPYFTIRIDASEGRSEITDDLPPYTVNSALTVNDPLPVMELDDSLDTSHLAVSILTKPMRRMTLDFKYRYEERDNTMPVLPWNYVRGDGADQQFPAYRHTVFNQPHEIQKDEFTVESTMRLRHGARLTVGYDYNEENRAFSAVDETEEDVYRAEFKFRIGNRFVTRVESRYSNLAGSSYDWDQAFFNTFAVGLINEIPDNQRFTNHPLLRQYHLANYEALKLSANFNYLINDSWNMMLDLQSRTMDYDKTVLGLRSNDNGMGNFSLNYTPSDSLSAWLWLSYGKNEMEQRGRAFSGGIEKPANEIFLPVAEGSDPTRDWDVDQEGENRSAGAGFEWTVIENKFEIKGDYTFVSTNIEDTFDVYGAPDLIGRDLPDIESDMHHLELSGDYHYSTELTLRLNYEYYRYKSEDWALNNVGLTTLDKVLSLGLRNPNEVINLISLTALYRF